MILDPGLVKVKFDMGLDITNDEHEFICESVSRMEGKEPIHEFKGRRKLYYCAICGERIKKWNAFCPICGNAIKW